MPTYVNPLRGARLTPERIDMGVDYAGTGNLGAIGRGVVTQVNPSGWGSFGGFIEYQLTEPGPLQGRYVYYAEGVNPKVRVGQTVNPGDTIASLIPGWHSGIEIGWGSGAQDQAYAAGPGGGYTEGQATAAGKSFSDLISSLGGPGGLLGGRKVTGSAPSGTSIPSQGGADTSSGGGGLPGVPQWITDIGDFLGDPRKALLAAGLVILGVILIYSGAGQALGFRSPVRSTAKAAAVARA